MEARLMSRDMLTEIVLVTLVVMPIFMMFVFFFLVAKIKVKASEKALEKAAEILEIYAARGGEPPAGVSEALIALAGGSMPKAAPAPAAPAPPPAPASPPTRARHLSDGARDLVVAACAAAIAWWRSPGPGEHPGSFMTWAVIAAVIFVAGAVWHLVTALQMRDEQ
jgi:hypothetical protein